MPDFSQRERTMTLPVRCTVRFRLTERSHPSTGRDDPGSGPEWDIDEILPQPVDLRKDDETVEEALDEIYETEHEDG